MSKKLRIKELVDEYNKWDKTDNNTKNTLAILSRDHKRKIKKIFEKEMHESIENYLDK